MPLGKDLLAGGNVLTYAGDVLEGMKLSRDLQYAAAQFAVFEHHHSIILAWNRHARPHGLKSLQKNRGMGPGASGVLRSNRKTVHGGAIKSGKGER